MPRWSVVALTLVLYAAAMGLIWWGLKTWVPPAYDWLNERLGAYASLTLLLALMAIAAVVAYWPRTSDGRLRRLLPRRH